MCVCVCVCACDDCQILSDDSHLYNKNYNSSKLNKAINEKYARSVRTGQLVKLLYAIRL